MNVEGLSAVARTRIRRPRSEVFAAFFDAEKMSQFWFTRRDAGLVAGESCTWYVGSHDGAFAFDVQVKEISEPDSIAIEWIGLDGNPTQVRWTFEEADEDDTLLTIEESGFTGSEESIVERALDSTGGFNQVIIAAKAFVEHGIALNVVADHA